MQWIAEPGEMIADQLTRDLGVSELFSRVVDEASPVGAPLELSGHVSRFAWQQADDDGRAVLALLVSLSDGADILWHERYVLEGHPVDDQRSGAFADQMSRLVKRLSRELRQDLAKIAGRQRREKAKLAPLPPGNMRR